MYCNLEALEVDLNGTNRLSDTNGVCFEIVMHVLFVVCWPVVRDDYPE